MREKIIIYLKTHPSIIRAIWSVTRVFLTFVVRVTKKQNTILFCSFGGRNFNDSPKAVYDEICSRDDFKDWRLVWAFVEPEKFTISRGEKVKVDTFSFFKLLVTSKVWVSNSGMDRGVDIITDKVIRVETWHGTPLKRICGEENQTSIVGNINNRKGPVDSFAIRCSQSEFDREIFSRVFHASKESILLSDLPRNDELLKYNIEKLDEIRKSLGISEKKKVILYTPTYREYLINESCQNFIAPPMDLKKWERELGNEYVLLIRAHYALSAALNIKENAFVKDVSSYRSLNDLYAISDMMISDYSSTYFDYAILDRPMLCFAYDMEEYKKKRGLYLDLNNDLPCKVCKHENEVISEIMNMDVIAAIEAAKEFHKKYAPYAGHASKIVVEKILLKLGIK